MSAEDDDTPSVFGGTSIAANRVTPRIILNIGNKVEKSSPSPPQLPPSLDDHIVTSTVSSNTSTPTSEIVSSTPIILKPVSLYRHIVGNFQGFSGLVDYDESDSDEEDQSSPEKCDSSSAESSLGVIKAIPSSTTSTGDDDDVRCD